jgi:pimeloyl-ACP methyl ester carboxylesterase
MSTAPSASIRGRSLPRLCYAVAPDPGASPGAAMVLVHSPLVGPTTWEPVATELLARGIAAVVPSLTAASRHWPAVVARVVQAVPPGFREVVLIGHSGAGVLLPAIADRLGGRVRAAVLVDAAVPHASGATPVVDASFRAHLERLAIGGLLPPWPAWWGDEAMVALVPDSELRERVVAECPRLALSDLDQEVPVPSSWAAVPCAYLRFSPSYEAQLAEAHARRWPVAELPGATSTSWCVRTRQPRPS